jgi:hypothetical protein
MTRHAGMILSQLMTPVLGAQRSRSISTVIDTLENRPAADLLALLSQAARE